MRSTTRLSITGMLLLCLGSSGFAQKVDREGDPLPEGAIARLGTSRFRQGFFCYAAEFSPDGSMIACASAGQGICLWDAKTGRRLAHFLPDAHSYSVSFSPDGRYLAAAGRGLSLWDMTTKQQVFRVDGHQGGATMVVSFSPDGKRIATGGHDHLVRLWDVPSGKELKLLKGHKNSVLSLAFSRDGKVLASAGIENSVRIWAPEKGELIAELNGHTKRVTSLVFTPDGGLVTGSEDNTLRYWDALGFKPGRVIEDSRGPVQGVAISPDGRTLAAALDDGSASLRDLSTGRERLAIKTGPMAVKTIAFSQDNRSIVSTGVWGCGPRVWDAATGKSNAFWDEHQGCVERLRISADGRQLLSVDRSSGTRKWDLASGKSEPWFRVPDAKRWHLRLSPDGKTAALSKLRGGPVILWDINTETSIRTFDVHESSEFLTTQCDYSPDGRHLATISLGSVLIWDVATGRKVREIDGLDKPTCLSYSPDGAKLASGGSATRPLRLWDLQTGKELGPIDVSLPVMAVIFSPDGKWLVGGGDFHNKALLWSLETLKPGPILLDQPSAGSYIHGFSPDGRFLIGGTESTRPNILIWDTLSGHIVHRFNGHASPITSTCFSRDGTTVFTGGSDSTILQWDLRHGMISTDSSPQAREGWWEELADGDVKKVLRAVWSLAATPTETTAMISRRLQPVPPLSSEREAQVRQWIKELDHTQFAVRRNAETELEKVGERLVPVLMAELQRTTSAEARNRLRLLLTRLGNPGNDPQQRRALRAIQVLEYAGGPSAAQLLTTLSKGDPESGLTRAAASALVRVQARK